MKPTPIRSLAPRARVPTADATAAAAPWTKARRLDNEEELWFMANGLACFNSTVIDRRGGSSVISYLSGRQVLSRSARGPRCGIALAEPLGRFLTSTGMIAMHDSSVLSRRDFLQTAVTAGLGTGLGYS